MRDMWIILSRSFFRDYLEIRDKEDVGVTLCDCRFFRISPYEELGNTIEWWRFQPYFENKMKFHPFCWIVIVKY